MKKIIILCLSLLLFVAVAVSWVWRDYNQFMQTPLNLSENMVFHVEKGFNLNKVIRELKQKGIDVNAYYLKFYGRYTKTGSQIKAGEYELSKGITPVGLMQTITSGKSINYQFTILEGSTFKQLRTSLLKTSNLVNDLEGLSNKDLLEKLGISFEHPEGLFLAETYSFERNTQMTELLKRAHSLLQKTLDDEWSSKKEGLPYKRPYESLIMASIIEKETARADERPVIAGVFVRRLHKGMRLQTDPTVIYGMGDSYKGNIRRSDLRKPTAYNTYVIPALPPTPIAMVGREAIAAALNPEPGNALFFVAKGDGSHYFSATLKEHNNAVREYQLKRRKDYRSSP
ncbi:MAG: endolytic transglycosylase MltG [Neptuniibacter sp.]